MQTNLSDPAISSDKVQGTKVYGADGKHIGSIDHLMIDKKSGRVTYAVMSFGGFLGIGDDHYPIPWGALAYDTRHDGYRTDITESQLEGAPKFTDDRWGDRQWETRVHEHYQAPFYWM